MKKTRSILMPLFLLALLLAGGGFHVWHHVLDPHCETGGPSESDAAGESHACVSCVALHGATATEIGVGVAPPVAAEQSLRAQYENDAPAAAVRGITATRAPPQV